MTMRCSRCHVEKDASAFTPSQARNRGYCKPCRADYMREYRGRTTADRTPRHGTRDEYSNHGCRCEACRTAGASAYAEYISDGGARDLHVTSNRNRRRATNGRSRSGYVWTGPELEAITALSPLGGYLRTEAELGHILGRSIIAVQRMRARCLSDPRYARLAGLDTVTADKARP